MKERLSDVGTNAISYGEELGADKVEVYMEAIRALVVSAEGSKVRSVAVKNDYGCGIRIVKENRIGFSFTTSISHPSVKYAAEQAIQLARIASRDDDFKDFPYPCEKYPQISGIYDKELRDLDPDVGIDIVMRGIETNSANLERYSPLHYAGFHAKDITRVIINSNDLSCTTDLSAIYMFLDATIRKDGKQGNSWEEQFSTKLNDLDPEGLGTRVAERVIGTLDKDEIDGGIMPVILSPSAVGHLFNSRRPGSLASALNYLEVQKMNSYLVDRIGSEVASNNLYLTDDALLEGGINSRPFDAEGSPSKKNDLIEHGVLLSYLHDSYSANKSGIENTSNAWRNTYADPLTIASSNLILKPGSKTESDMISEIARGVYCQFTGDLPNPVSGDLNAIIMEGFLIEGGEKSHSVENTMFSVNMLELLKSIVMIGNNPKITENGIFPSIMIGSANVTSGKS